MSLSARNPTDVALELHGAQFTIELPTKSESLRAPWTDNGWMEWTKQDVETPADGGVMSLLRTIKLLAFAMGTEPVTLAADRSKELLSIRGVIETLFGGAQGTQLCIHTKDTAISGPDAANIVLEYSGGYAKTDRYCVDIVEEALCAEAAVPPPPSPSPPAPSPPPAQAPKQQRQSKTTFKLSAAEDDDDGVATTAFANEGDASSTWGWGVAIAAAAIFGCLAVVVCVACVYGFTLCIKIHKRGAGGGATYVGGEAEMAEVSAASPRSPRGPAGPRARV